MERARTHPLPNNNSSISAVKLQSGRIAIAYNPTCTPNPVPGKAAWPGLRCPVAVALSEDSGLTFPIIRWMERGEGYMGDENKTNNKQYEYPYLMQGRRDAASGLRRPHPAGHQVCPLLGAGRSGHKAGNRGSV